LGGRIRSSRPSPAIIVAVLALVAALAGTAVAGPNASTSAVSKKKVKKIAKKQAVKQINELAPGLSVANAVNAQNAATADNAANAGDATNLGGVAASDYRRYGGAIPSGKTVVGGWGLSDANLSAGQVAAVETVQFPMPAPVNLADSDVNFAPSASAQDDDPACTGGVDQPTAPGGKVCIYISQNTATNVGGSLRANAMSSSGSGARFGFTVVGQATIAGGVQAQGSWAYRAP
jgi:hypothetical protein